MYKPKLEITGPAHWIVYLPTTIYPGKLSCLLCSVFVAQLDSNSELFSMFFIALLSVEYGYLQLAPTVQNDDVPLPPIIKPSAFV